MPFTRITLRQGYSEAALYQISTLLQQALVAEFDVPEHDCFQLIEMLPAGQRYLIVTISAADVATISCCFR